MVDSQITGLALIWSSHGPIASWPDTYMFVQAKREVWRKTCPASKAASIILKLSVLDVDDTG